MKTPNEIFDGIAKGEIKYDSQWWSKEEIIEAINKHNLTGYRGNPEGYINTENLLQEFKGEEKMDLTKGDWSTYEYYIEQLLLGKKMQKKNWGNHYHKLIGSIVCNHNNEPVHLDLNWFTVDKWYIYEA